MSNIINLNEPQTKMTIDGNQIIDTFFDKMLQSLMIRFMINTYDREDALKEIEESFKINESAFDASLSFLKVQDLGAFLKIKKSINDSYDFFVSQINKAYEQKEGPAPEENTEENEAS